MSERLKVLSDHPTNHFLDGSNTCVPHISALDPISRPKPLFAMKNIWQTSDWKLLRKTCLKTVSKCYYGYNTWQSKQNRKAKGIGSSFRKTTKSLSMLQMNLPSNHLPDRKALLLNMRFLSCLRVLYLNFGYLPDIRGRYSQDLDLCICFKDLLLLHTLKLDFTMFPLIKDKDLERTFSGFKYLAQLSTLDLDLRSCAKITGKSMKNIFKNLRNLTLLSKINMNLNFAHGVYAKHTEPFSTTLPHLRSLLSLILDLRTYENYITDHAIQNLSRGIGCAESLLLLKINLYAKGGIARKGLGTLSLALSHLINLRHFELKITGCSSIDDTGIQSLSAGLSCLRSLLSLTISLEECSRITDRGIQSLSVGVGHLVSLSSLTLIMVNCRNIADKSIEDLSISLSYLSYLNTLNIRLLSPESRITDIGIEALSLGFRCLSPNALVCVRFSKCSEVTDKSLENMIAILKSRNTPYHVTCNSFSVSSSAFRVN